MIENTHVILNKLGVHARPAAEITKVASKFKSDISLINNGKEINAKSLLMIMSLGIKNGDELTVRVNGNDEDEAMEALNTLIENNFYED